MKKYRKQSVYVFGCKRLADVPVDEKLYEMDNRENYTRRRSKSKDVSLKELLSHCTADVAEIYEKTQILQCLSEALQSLTKKERLLIECIYYKGLSQKKTAKILIVSQQSVSQTHEKIIKKLRSSLKEWL